MSNIFSFILTVSTLIAGIIWIINYFNLKLFHKKKIEQQKKLLGRNIEKKYLDKSVDKLSWMSSFSSIFPTLALVLVIRSFIYEPFQIPSSSMMPTLLAGDFILVEKFAYSLRNPITQKKLLLIGKPKRGDIAVFKYVKDPNINFVKRVIGLPGDKIIYLPAQKELHIYPNCSITNCMEPLPIMYSSLKESTWAIFFNINSMTKIQRSYQIPLNKALPRNAFRQVEKIENLNGNVHKILLIPQAYTKSHYQQPDLPENEWIVPPKHYFMLGDNRDNSADSRSWGFVPEDNLVGRAVIIWFSLDKQEDEWPTGIRLSRIGKIK